MTKLQSIEGGKGIGSCNQLLKWIEEWNPRMKRVDQIPVYCNKVTDEGHALCPHHELMNAEAPLERKRRAQRSLATKARKKLQEEMLEASPLRAENPTFASADAESHGAYSDAGGMDGAA